MTDEVQNRIPLGTYKRILDQKYRITVPGPLRDPPLFINDLGFITLHQPRRLLLLPHGFVKQISKGQLKGYGKREREAYRNLLVSLQEVYLDGRGRVTIPHELSIAMDIHPGEKLIITVSGGWVELWQEKEWEKGIQVNGLFKF